MWVDGGAERKRRTGCTGDVQLKIKNSRLSPRVRHVPMLANSSVLVPQFSGCTRVKKDNP